MIRTLNILSKTALASAAFFALAGMAHAATKVGVIGAHNGTITVLDEAGESRSVKNGDAIYLNETVNTGDASSAQIMFLDRSALTVSPGSSIKVDTFVFDPKATSGNKMTMQGAKGAFRFIGGALSKKEPVEIKTPVATIGIRGGIGDVHHQQGSATTGIVLFGEGSMTPSGGSPIRRKWRR